MIEQEVWKDIEGYEGLYLVSNLGRVKSLNYHQTKVERLLKLNLDGSYLFVRLCKDGIEKMFKVHRLIAQAFIPNLNNLPQVNHKNEVKTDNRVENLEWCSASYNINYGTRNQRMAESHSKTVIQLDLQGKFVKRWNSIIEAERECGFHNGAIVKCCQGKRHTHKGYRWQYAE